MLGVPKALLEDASHVLRWEPREKDVFGPGVLDTLLQISMEPQKTHEKEAAFLCSMLICRGIACVFHSHV